jgi:hypothetical protein
VRFLVVVCLGIILISVAVFSSLAHAQSLCSPTTPVTTNTITPSIVPGSVLINEIMTKPTSTTSLNCTTQAISGWLEVFNPQNQAYNLGSVYAALDNGAGTNPYYLANNSAIAAHGYLVLFPPTRLLLSGPIRLLFEGVLIDQVTVPDLNAGQSYARLPDGGTNWQVTTTPTMGTSNSSTSSIPTLTPLSTRVTHKTSISTKTTHQQNALHITSGTTKMIQSTSISTQIVTGQQPAWSALHIPQVESGSQPLPNTISAPADSIASNPTGISPLLPLLLGAIILIGLTRLLLIWYKRQQKAT